MTDIKKFKLKGLNGSFFGPKINAFKLFFKFVYKIFSEVVPDLMNFWAKNTKPTLVLVLTPVIYASTRPLSRLV